MALDVLVAMQGSGQGSRAKYKCHEKWYIMGPVIWLNGVTQRRQLFDEAVGEIYESLPTPSLSLLIVLLVTHPSHLI